MHTPARQSHLKRALVGAAAATILLGFCAPRAAEAQFTYSLEDGTAENAVGLTAGGSPIFLNSFTVSGGNNLITGIQVAFGNPGSTAPSVNGLSYTVALWSDPNGDGLPADAVLLTSMAGIVVGADTNTFVLSLITPTTVLTSNFFVGFVITHAMGQFPAAFDQTAPSLAGRSFVNTSGNINSLAGSITIESAGLTGNWLIRATAIPEPSTYALVGLGLGGILFLGRRAKLAAR